MPKFRIGWYSHGWAEVEADDVAEAMDVTQEGLQTFDASLFEEFEVQGTGVMDE